MEEKQDLVNDIKHKERERKFLKILAALGIAAILILGVYYINPLNMENNIIPSQGAPEPDPAKTIIISDAISPYRTTITKSEIVELRNNRQKEIKISFETNDIDETFTIPANQSSYFNASKYGKLPKTNYFNLESGSTGEIVIQ